MVIPETEGSLNVDDHDRRLSLIDFSSADDSLITNPFLNQQRSECAGLLCTPNSKKFEDAATKLQEWERESQPNETLDIEKPMKISTCNLRQSLAWDSAFFTSAGVLDAEELSSIIEGVEKNEKRALQLLPGIEEDVNRSCESISTLESDSFTMERLEANVFHDVRASIQKSGRLSNVVNTNSKVPSTGGDSSKKLGLASCNKMKAPSFKSPSAAMQGTGKITKKSPNFPQLPQKHVAIRGGPSVLKQPNVLGVGKCSSSSKLSLKLASPGDLHVKSEKDKAKQITSGKVSSVSDASVIRSSRAIVPKSTLPSKSPSVPSVALKTKSTISKSPGGNLPANISKSTVNSLKRKVDGGTKKPLSSCSSVKTPSKLASRDKTASSGSSLSSLLSVTKLSSSISPASSIGDWSLESPSSTSLAKYRSNSSMTTFYSSSSRKRLSDINAQQSSNSQNPRSNSRLGGKVSRHTGFISQSAKTPAAGTVLSPAPMRTSGLRLPSPTIGFFDGVKSSMSTPGRGTQQHSGIRHSLPKHGARSVNPSEGQNKAKLGKLQPARSSMSTENKKSSNQQTSHPIPPHESSDVAIGTSTALKNVKSSSEVHMEVQNKTYLETGTRNLEANNDLAEGNLIGIHDLNLASTQDNGTLDNSIEIIDSDIKGSIRSDDKRVTSTSTTEKLNSSEYVENTSSSKVVGDCLIYDHSSFPKAEDPTLINYNFGNHNSDMCSTENKEVLQFSTDKMSPESNSGMHSHNNETTTTNADHDPCVSSATENLGNASPSHVVEKASEFCQNDLINNLDKLHGDKVDCLSRQVGLLDINLETQKRFKGDSPFSEPDVRFQDKSDGLELSGHAS